MKWIHNSTLIKHIFSERSDRLENGNLTMWYYLWKSPVYTLTFHKWGVAWLSVKPYLKLETLWTTQIASHLACSRKYLPVTIFNSKLSTVYKWAALPKNQCHWLHLAPVSCHNHVSNNLIYLITCELCHTQYVGWTKNNINCDRIWLSLWRHQIESWHHGL